MAIYIFFTLMQGYNGHNSDLYHAINDQVKILEDLFINKILIIDICSIISTNQSSEHSTITITNSFHTSTSTLKSLTSIVSSTMVLQYSSNVYQNNVTRKSIVTTSSPGNSMSFI
jgi:hypothetical protein